MPMNAGSRHPLIGSARIAGLVIAAVAEGIEAWPEKRAAADGGVGAEADDGCGCKGPAGKAAWQDAAHRATTTVDGS
jgi:hypothetical protein